MPSDTHPLTRGQESILLDFVQRLERFTQDRIGVHLHLSRLQPHKRRDHHLRIALNSLEDLLSPHESQIFPLDGADIIFICRKMLATEIDTAILRMMYLFSDDPITKLESETSEYSQFATIYKLDEDYDVFLDLVKKQILEAEDTSVSSQSLYADEYNLKSQEKRPLNPEDLGKLEKILVRSDLDPVLKRQAVCAISYQDAAPKPIFREVFISIADLAEMVTPTIDLASDTWLFQYLTKILDRRVLYLLSQADDRTLYNSISINLNVDTVLSNDFLNFDRSLRTGGRGTFILEFQYFDIMVDLEKFRFARDFLHQKGYRICLDNVTSDSLQFIDRSGLLVDLVKLKASDIFLADSPADLQVLVHDINRIGKERIILSHIDHPLMVKNGQNLGITMYQGKYIDNLLSDFRNENRSSM